MTKKSIFKIILLLFVISFYFSIDFALSNTIYKKTDCFNYSYYQSGYYYELEKNCKSKYRFKSGFPTVDFITDQQGLRTSNMKKIKSNTKENIFLFGDSFTFGVGLNYNDTYAGIIENKLQNYNFYNFAVGSYSPTVHLHRFQKALENKIIPKKIFLFLDLTDVIDESQRWVNDKNLNIPIRPEKKKKGKNFFQKNFKFSVELSTLIKSNVRAIKKKYLSNKNDKIEIKTSIQGQFTYTPKDKLNKIFWKKGDFSKGIGKIEKNIKKISEITKLNNTEFYIVVYPWAETLEYGQQEFSWSNFANSLCKKYHCKTIDTIPAFNRYKSQNINWSSDLYFIGDEHFNMGGAKLLAETVLLSLKN